MFNKATSLSSFFNSIKKHINLQNYKGDTKPAIPRDGFKSRAFLD